MVRIEFIEEVREVAKEISEHYFERIDKKETLSVPERDALKALITIAEQILKYDEAYAEIHTAKEEYLRLKRQGTY